MVELLNRSQYDTLSAHHPETRERVELNLTLPEAPAWQETHPGFIVDAVVIREREQLPLVSLLRPTTLIVHPAVDQPLLEELTTLARASGSIQQLSLHFYDVIDLLPLSSLAGLRTLMLSSPKRDRVPLNLDKLVGLRRLDAELNEFPVLAAALQLEELRLRCVYTDNFTFDRIASQTGLRSLEVVGPMAASTRGLSCRKLAAMKSLEHFRLDKVPARQVSTLSKLTHLRSIELFGKRTSKKPESLDLSNVSELRSLTAFSVQLSGLEKAVKLEKLEVSSGPDEVDLEVVSALPSLEKLRLGSEHVWTPEQLDVLARRPGLQVWVGSEYLSLSETRRRLSN